MLSSILNSEQAIKMNIFIIKTFIRLREFLLSNDELERRLISLEDKVDIQFDIIFNEMESMRLVKIEPRVKIGFRIKGQE